MKKYIILLTFCFSLILVFNKIEAKENKSNYVKVVYFHGDYRCVTCNKIERYIKSAVKNFFKEELKNDKVVLEIINYDKKDNEHYMEDYNLYNQTLIISVFKNGKEIKWKNADKIWEKVSDETKFKSYVKSEVQKSLKEL